MNSRIKLSLFRKHLFSYLAIVTIPILILGLFINNTLIKTLKKQYGENSMQALSQLMYISDNNMGQLDVIQQHLMLNKNLNVTYNIDNVIVAQDIICELSKYKNSNNFIQDMGLYFIGDSYLYTQSSTYTIDAFSTKMDKYSNMDSGGFLSKLASATIKTVIPLDAPVNDGNNKNTLMVMYPLNIAQKKAMLLFYIDSTFSYKPDASSSYIILDENDQIVSTMNVNIDFNSQQTSKINNLGKEGYGNYDEIEIPQKNGVFFATAVKSPTTGWKYIYMTPTKKVYGEVIQIQFHFFFILFTVIIISIALIQIGMSVNYRPLRKLQSFASNINKNSPSQKDGIESIKDTISYLATQNSQLKTSATYALKMQFLQHILKGKIKDEDEFCEKMASLQLDSLKNDFYCVIIIYVRDMSENSNDKIDVTEIEAWINQLVNGYCRDDSEKNKYIFIGALDQDACHKLKHTLLDLQELLQQKFGYDIVVASSSVNNSFKNIPHCYLEASLAIDYRFVKGYNCVIHSSELVLNDDIGAAYPRALFDKLNYQIKQGDANQIEQVLSDIICYIRDSDIPLYYAKGLCYQLINTISTVISELNNELLISKDEISYATVLADFDTAYDLIEAVKNICLNICAYMRTNQAVEGEEVISLMKAYINKNYSDCNFSIQCMAEHFDMSLPAISLYFKNKCDTTIISYITLIRMNKSKQLLVETNYSLNQITTEIGYVNTSSFIRKFKALNGITPGQFVKIYKKL